MENDELKDHVSGRRQEFEVYDFDLDKSWDNISERLKQKEESHVKVPLKIIWRVAAIFLISIGATFYLAWANLSYRSIDSISSLELAEADAYYGNLISNKVLQLRRSKSEIDPNIYEDIEALDVAFLELKEDLKDNADNDEVVNAMILNYKIKLEILERILVELDIEEGE
jgi:hypothetical protein